MARKIEVEIVGDSSSLERAFRNTGKAGTTLGQKLKKVGRAAAIGLGVGVAAAAVELKRSVDAAMEAQVAQGRLQAQLKASGISYERYADQIDKTLQAQAELSAFDDEDLSDSFTNLVRVTEDVNEALRLNALAADFARAKGIDVAKAGELIGKVAGGNLGILSRYGIALKDNATKEEALAVLRRKFAGQAKAYGDSAIGAQERLGVAIENVEESLGNLLLPTITKVADKFSDFIGRFTSQEGFVAKLNIAWTGIESAVHDLLGKIQDALFGSREALKLPGGQILEWKETQGLVDTLKDALESANWSEIGQTIGENLTSKIKLTAEFMNKVLDTLGTAIEAHSGRLAELGALMLLKIVDKLLDPAFWAKNWKLVLGIAAAVFPFGRLVTIGGKAALFLLRPLAKLLPKGFQEIGSRSVNAMLEILSKLPGKLQALVVKMIEQFGRLVSFIRGKLKAAFDALPGWIQAAFRVTFVVAIINKVQDLIDKIRDLISAIGGIHWPSPPGWLGSIGGAIAGATGIPHPATGGRVMKGGLARIHTGETITPARVALGGGTGGGVPGGPVMVLTTHEIARWLQDQNRRYALSNGGRGIFG